MSSNDGQQFLIRTDTSFKLFYVYEKTLYLTIFNNDNKKEDVKIVAKGIDCFGVGTDDEGTIHIVCINSQGSLILFTNEKDRWMKKVIGNVDINSYYIKDLKIYILDSDINIFFMIADKKKDNLWNIIHYSINDNKYKNHKVADIISDKYFSSFKIDIDSNGNIHLIYKSIVNDKYVLFYKMYNSNFKTWSLRAKLSNESHDTINFGILCDSNDYVHVIWSCINHKNIEVNYIKKKVNSTINSGWLKSKTFPKNISNFTNPILIQCNSNIKLIWKQINKIFFTKINLNGDSWSDIKRIEDEQFYNLSSIMYIGKTYKNYGFVKVPLTYGNCENGIFLIGLDDIDKQVNFLNLFYSGNYEDFTEINDLENIEDIQEAKFNVKDYINHINQEFDKESIIIDLFKKEKNRAENYVDNSNNLGWLDEDIFYEIFSLKSEINNLKLKEVELENSITKLNSNLSELKEKIEEILSKFNHLEKNQ